MTDPTGPDDALEPELDAPPADEPAPEDFEDHEAEEAEEAKERALEEAAAAAAASPAAARARAGRGRGPVSPTAPATAPVAGQEVLPYIDDRGSKIWVAVIVLIFVGIFLNGIFLGVGGVFHPIVTPSPTLPYCAIDTARPPRDRPPTPAGPAPRPPARRRHRRTDNRLAGTCADALPDLPAARYRHTDLDHPADGHAIASHLRPPAPSSPPRRPAPGPTPSPSLEPSLTPTPGT